MKAYETYLTHKNRKRLVSIHIFFFKLLSFSTSSNMCDTDFTTWRQNDSIRTWSPAWKIILKATGYSREEVQHFKHCSCATCIKLSSYFNDKWDLRICVLGNPLPCPSCCSRTLKGKTNACPTCHTIASLLPNMVDFRKLQDGWKIWSLNRNAKPVLC